MNAKIWKFIIRDQIVLNINKESLQERLIEIPDLQLVKAVQIIKLVKNTKQQVRQVNNKESKMSVDIVKDIRVFAFQTVNFFEFGASLFTRSLLGALVLP